MAVRTRGDERKSLVDLFESGEFESADKMADATIKKTFEMVKSRVTYVLGVDVEPGFTLPYGPYYTEAEAKAAAKLIGGPIKGIVKLNPPNNLTVRMAELDRPLEPSCEDCNHKWAIHADSGNRPGCTQKGCACGRRHA